VKHHEFAGFARPPSNCPRTARPGVRVRQQAAVSGRRPGERSARAAVPAV